MYPTTQLYMYSAQGPLPGEDPNRIGEDSVINANTDLVFAMDQMCINDGNAMTNEGFRSPFKGTYRFSFSATTAPNRKAYTRVEVLRLNHITKQLDPVFWISDCAQRDSPDMEVFNLMCRGHRQRII